MNLFSKFMKTDETDVLLEINKCLSDKQFLNSISTSALITNELKLFCYRTVLIFDVKVSFK